MKRFWIGSGILLVLLASGWGIAEYTEQTLTPISRELALASEAAIAMRQQDALLLAEQAYARWLCCRDLAATVADHAVLEEIDSLFLEIQVYIATGDTVPFSAACACLSSLTKAVAESHQLIWQNLL